MLTEVERQVVEILKERGGRATLKEVALELHRRLIRVAQVKLPVRQQ